MEEKNLGKNSTKESTGIKYEEAVARLEEYKKMKKELRSAKKAIFNHELKKGKDAIIGVLKGIERWSIKNIISLNSKLDSVKNVGVTSKDIAGKVKAEAEEMLEATEKFSIKQSKRNEFESIRLDDKIERTEINSNVRTFTGSMKARLFKMPYTFAARYQALIGNEEKKEEFLNKAEDTTKRIMKGVKTKNREKQLKTQKNVTTRNNIERRSEKQKETIENKSKRTTERADSWKENYSEDGKRDKMAKRIRRIDGFSNQSAKFVAKMGQMPLTTLSRFLTTIGVHQAAETVSKAAGKFSRAVMDGASKEATKRHRAFDRTVKTAETLENKVEKEENEHKEFNESYRSEHVGEKSGKHISTITKGITKFISGRAMTSAKRKINRYELAAERAILLGDKERAEALMEKAKTKSTKKMENAQKTNDTIRDVSDWTIQTKENIVEGTKTVVKATGRAIEKGMKTVGMGIVDASGIATYGAVKGIKAIGRSFKKTFDATIEFGEALYYVGEDKISEIKEKAEKKSEERSSKGNIIVLREGRKKAMAAMEKTVLPENGKNLDKEQEQIHDDFSK